MPHVASGHQKLEEMERTLPWSLQRGHGPTCTTKTTENKFLVCEAIKVVLTPYTAALGNQCTALSQDRKARKDSPTTSSDR